MHGTKVTLEEMVFILFFVINYIYACVYNWIVESDEKNLFSLLHACPSTYCVPGI